MQREIVRLLNARNRAGGDVPLQSGTVVDGFRIVRCAEPGSETYVAEFECERLALSCPLYVFLPRTRIVDPTIKA